jgi:hypothetical protein
MKMGFLIVAGGIALLYFGSRPGSPLATALSGATHMALKLGNADPNFEPWLAEELTTLIGPHSTAVGFEDVDTHHQSAASRDGLARAIRARRLIDYTTRAPLSGTGSSFSSAAGVTRGIAQWASKSPDPVSQSVAAVSSFVSSILSVFGAHHAAAVQKEQATLNAAVPQVNQALDAIDQSYRLGQLGSAQVATYLEELYSQFVAGLATIAIPTPFDPATTIQRHSCNAGCTEERALRGIIDAMKVFDY